MKKFLVFLTLGILIGLPFSNVKAQQALAVGTLAPEFSGTSVTGEKVSLNKLRKKGPVIIMFYRGEWCPFCNSQAKAMQDSLKYIIDAGGSVVAISPEKTENAKKSIQKSGATFPFLHDRNAEIMNAYGVAFKVDDKTKAKYKEYGIDFDEVNGENGATLPVPAVYIVGTDGIIKWVHFNKDYRVRPSVATLAEQLNALKINSLN